MLKKKKKKYIYKPPGIHDNLQCHPPPIVRL